MWGVKNGIVELRIKEATKTKKRIEIYQPGCRVWGKSVAAAAAAKKNKKMWWMNVCECVGVVAGSHVKKTYFWDRVESCEVWGDFMHDYKDVCTCMYLQE